MEYAIVLLLIYSIAITIAFYGNKYHPLNKPAAPKMPNPSLSPKIVKNYGVSIMEFMSKVTQYKDVKLAMRGNGFDMVGFVSEYGDYILFYRDVERTQFICAIMSEEVKIITLA